jgi:hypothetical protein
MLARLLFSVSGHKSLRTESTSASVDRLIGLPIATTANKWQKEETRTARLPNAGSGILCAKCVGGSWIVFNKT